MPADSVSVIVCTYNRSGSLLDTLDSLANMVVSKSVDWEVLVVDNNSTDDTKKITEAFIDRGNHHFRYLLEPVQGLSFARNRGINTSGGRILAFTDDDVLVDKNWLMKIIETIELYNADCVGGKVLPLWLAPRPRWLPDNLLNVLAMLDLGEDVIEFGRDAHRDLYGANFAFKKEFFLKHGLFDVRFGRLKAVGGGEDEEMLERLLAVGGKAIYNPGIVVNHKVFPERLEKSYFRKWYYQTGQYVGKRNDSSRIMVLGIPAYAIRESFLLLIKYLTSIVTLKSHSVFLNELKLIHYYAFFRKRMEQSFRNTHGTKNL